MAYKSLLTIVTRPDLPASTLTAAIALARAHDAHLELLCLGIDRTQVAYYTAGATIALPIELFDVARDTAKQIEAAVLARMAGEDIRWSCDSTVAQLGTLTEAVSNRARYCDLVILPRPFGAQSGEEDRNVVEAALFDGQAPVLIIPDGAVLSSAPQRIVVAWNQGVEALHAVRQAMPFLCDAKRVNVAVIDPPRHSPERSDPGGALAQMLARHGVHIEVSVLARTMSQISVILQRHAADQNADMLVMGAYGHSRFREAILGGATHDMLEGAELPVFLAH